jgi:hypothetical protein
MRSHPARKRIHATRVAVGFLSLLASGCVRPGPAFTPSAFTQATGQLNGERVANEASGENRECIWLTGEDGSRMYIELSAPIHVGFDPLKLTDASGAPIAETGDTLTVAGSTRLGAPGCDPSAPLLKVELLSGPFGPMTVGR